MSEPDSKRQSEPDPGQETPQPEATQGTVPVGTVDAPLPGPRETSGIEINLSAAQLSLLPRFFRRLNKRAIRSFYAANASVSRAVVAHGSDESTVVAVELDAPDPALQAEFSTLLETLDASNAESAQRQAVIAELRQATEAELSALAEAVAAL